MSKVRIKKMIYKYEVNFCSKKNRYYLILQAGPLTDEISKREFDHSIRPRSYQSICYAGTFNSLIELIKDNIDFTGSKYYKGRDVTNDKFLKLLKELYPIEDKYYTKFVFIPDERFKFIDIETIQRDVLDDINDEETLYSPEEIEELKNDFAEKINKMCDDEEKADIFVSKIISMTDVIL